MSYTPVRAGLYLEDPKVGERFNKAVKHFHTSPSDMARRLVTRGLKSMKLRGKAKCGGCKRDL